MHDIAEWDDKINFTAKAGSLQYQVWLSKGEACLYKLHK